MKKTVANTNGLKLLLSSQNMKQKELAEALNVSQAIVSQWATGKIRITKKTQDEILRVIKERNQVVVSQSVAPSVEVEHTMKEQSTYSMTLEEKINSCKKYCLDTYGFEVVVVK